MRTRGEIEAAITEEISRFKQDYMGRNPKDIQVHLLYWFAFEASWQ
jgi:uncharacterized protein YbcI